jgi:hypothetical protein
MKSGCETSVNLILQDRADVFKDVEAPERVAGNLAQLTLAIYRLPSAFNLHFD